MLSDDVETFWFKIRIKMLSVKSLGITALGGLFCIGGMMYMTEDRVTSIILNFKFLLNHKI